MQSLWTFCSLASNINTSLMGSSRSKNWSDGCLCYQDGTVQNNFTKPREGKFIDTRKSTSYLMYWKMATWTEMAPWMQQQRIKLWQLCCNARQIYQAIFEAWVYSIELLQSIAQFYSTLTLSKSSLPELSARTSKKAKSGQRVHALRHVILLGWSWH